jgi:hypothetical protein
MARRRGIGPASSAVVVVAVAVVGALSLGACGSASGATADPDRGDLACLGWDTDRNDETQRTAPPPPADPYGGLSAEEIARAKANRRVLVPVNNGAAPADVERAEDIVEHSEGLDVLVGDHVRLSATGTWADAGDRQRGVWLVYSAVPAISVPTTFSRFASPEGAGRDGWVHDDRGMPVVESLPASMRDLYGRATSVEVHVDLTTGRVYALSATAGQDVYNPCGAPTYR